MRVTSINGSIYPITDTSEQDAKFSLYHCLLNVQAGALDSKCARNNREHWNILLARGCFRGGAKLARFPQSCGVVLTVQTNCSVNHLLAKQGLSDHYDTSRQCSKNQMRAKRIVTTTVSFQNPKKRQQEKYDGNHRSSAWTARYMMPVLRESYVSMTHC